MNKKFYLLGSLALISLMSSCGSDDSSSANDSRFSESWYTNPASSGKEEIALSATAKRDKMHCEVYSNSNSVTSILGTVIYSTEIKSSTHIGIENNETNLISIIEAIPASEGLTNMLCKQGKEEYASYIKEGIATIDCSHDYVQLEMSMGGAMGQYAFERLIQNQIKSCESAKEDFLADAEEEDDSDFEEQDTGITCKVTSSDNTITQTLTTSDGKTIISEANVTSTGTTIVETYTGFDDATLSRACEQEEGVSVTCNGNTVTAEVSFISTTAFQMSELIEMAEEECHDVEIGKETLEEFMFD